MSWGRRFVPPAIPRSPRGVRALSLLLPPLLASALGCARGGAVERIEDGRREVGRVIPPAAYAAYAMGIEHEAAGRIAAARGAYDDARRLDPESGAAWAALGRVVCDESLEQAIRTFQDGLERATEPLPILLERASCRARRGQLDAALVDARSALELAPSLPRVTALYADVLDRLGRPSEAAAARSALDDYRRESTPPLDAARDTAAVDHALSRGDFVVAERLSTGLMGPGELALRALALGQTDGARDLAALVLAADPSSADAAAVLLLAGDSLTLPGSDEVPEFGPLSPLGVCLLAQHVGARTSARSWTPEPAPEPVALARDPLLSRCREQALAGRAP